MDNTDRPRKPDGFYTLLDQLRAVAALAVVWAHLVGYFLAQTGRSWPPYAFAERFIEKPLEIVGDFGWMGVAVFFLISGFVITHAATRETSAEFIVKRLLRIYPPLVFAVTVALLLSALTGQSLMNSVGSPFTPLDYLANVSLLNYAVAPRVILLTVAWTLAIEMSFYLLMWATKGLLLRAGWLVTPVILAVVVVGLATSSMSATNHLVALTLAFVPILLLGQLAYLTLRRRIHPALGVILAAVSWIVFVIGMQRLYPENLVPGNSYPQNAAVAILIFIVALLAEKRLLPSKILSVVARRSYSLYLVHAPLGLTILGLLFHNSSLPYTVMLIIAIASVAVVTELSYRVIEKPSIGLGRRLFSTIRSAAARSNTP